VREDLWATQVTSIIFEEHDHDHDHFKNSVYSSPWNDLAI